MTYEQTTAGVAESNAGGDKRSGYTLCPGSPTALALGNSLGKGEARAIKFLLHSSKMWCLWQIW